MVMPGDNVKLAVELIMPIAMEEGPALCHPRRRPHRRRRRRRQDHRLIERRAHARLDFVRLRPVQAAQLHDDQEQEEDDGEAVLPQILPRLSIAHAPQGGEGLIEAATGGQ
jgi:hypothetical protein